MLMNQPVLDRWPVLRRMIPCRGVRTASAAFLFCIIGAGSPAAQDRSVGAADGVRWSEAREYRRLAPAVLPADQREIVLGSPVPVLLPDCGAPCRDLLDDPLIIVAPRWYSASLAGDRHSVLIIGTPTPARIGGAGAARLPVAAGDPLPIERRYGIVEYRVRAFGAVYVVNIECSRPWDDPRCTEDGYAGLLAGGLAVAAVPR